MTIFTIGHSTRSIEEFIDLLRSQDITQLVDIRTVPKSLKNPQYQQAALRESLRAAGIDYRYLKELGGLRPKAKHSTNTAWRNQSFRNYADYMQTEEFVHGVETLMELGRQAKTVIMCAEAVPWRCHRSLVGDALIVRDVSVQDIMSASSVKPHTLTSFAAVSGTKVTYPGDDMDNDES